MEAAFGATLAIDLGVVMPRNTLLRTFDLRISGNATQLSNRLNEHCPADSHGFMACLTNLPELYSQKSGIELDIGTFDGKGKTVNLKIDGKVYALGDENTGKYIEVDITIATSAVNAECLGDPDTGLATESHICQVGQIYTPTDNMQR